jgi:cytochrome d ubiquinol oxidase subunit II
VLSVVLFAAGGLMVAKSGMGMRLEGAVDAGPSNPLLSHSVAAGAWLDNYARIRG